MANTHEKTYCLYFILIQRIIETPTAKKTAVTTVGRISRKYPWKMAACRHCSEDLIPQSYPDVFNCWIASAWEGYPLRRWEIAAAMTFKAQEKQTKRRLYTNQTKVGTIVGPKIECPYQSGPLGVEWNLRQDKRLISYLSLNSVQSKMQ